MKNKYPRIQLIFDLRKAIAKRQKGQEIEDEDMEMIEVEKDEKIIRVKKGGKS
jgi:hypothetical protein